MPGDDTKQGTYWREVELMTNGFEAPEDYYDAKRDNTLFVSSAKNKQFELLRTWEQLQNDFIKLKEEYGENG